MYSSSYLWSWSRRRFACWIRDSRRYLQIRTCSYHRLRRFRSGSSVGSSLWNLDWRCNGFDFEVSPFHLNVTLADMSVKDGNTCSTYLVVLPSFPSSLDSLLFLTMIRHCITSMRIDGLIGLEGLSLLLDCVCFASV
jgi:hypothetical protein